MVALKRRSILAMLALVGTTPRAFAQQSLPKVAFVLSLPPDKSGWSYEHARGVELARQTLEGRVQIDVAVHMPDRGAGDMEFFEGLVAEGYDMIVGCSPAYERAMLQTSFAAPYVKFEQCGGQMRTANLSNYSARWYEGRKIEGILAGGMTKTKRIGYIAPFPTNQVLRNINAAFIGARQMDPDVHLDVLWLNDWFNPQTELQAAKFLVAKGVDVFLQDTFSPAPTIVAQTLGYYALGKSTDMSAYGPDAQLMTMTDNWGPYYVDRITALLEGTWSPADTWGGLGQKMIEITSINDELPSRVVDQARGTLERIADGTEHVFAGPVKRRDGSIWMQEGQSPSDTELQNMDFFVEGIKSILPTGQ